MLWGTFGVVHIASPVLALFYSKPYWYMFSFIPVIVVYLSCIYCKDIVTRIKRRRKA